MPPGIGYNTGQIFVPPSAGGGFGQQPQPSPSQRALTSKRSSRKIPAAYGHEGGEDIYDDSAEIAQRAAEARLRTLQPYLDRLTTPAGAPPVGAPAGPTGDENAARAAAFARAKDMAGKTARSSLTALQEIMASRGEAGGGREFEGTQAILEGGQSRINEFGREQLMNDLNRAADISDRDYQGAITQRGQDLGQRQQSLQALLSLLGQIY